MLDSFIVPRYSGCVAEKQAATGFGDLTIGGQPPQRGFFTSAHLCTSNQWVGLGGETFGSAGSNPGSPTPLSARPPRLATDGGSSILIGVRND